MHAPTAFSNFQPTLRDVVSRPESSTLSCALTALKKQFIGFRFDYPLEIVSGCDTRSSLAYYLYGDRLSWSALRLDASGVPQTWFRMTGRQYWPAYIAWYGLVNLGHFVHKRDAAARDVFLTQIQWLKDHAVVRHDGSVVWTMDFDYPIGNITMKAPWVSSHAQGLCISALVRGWRITRDPSLLHLLQRSAIVFTQDHRQGGIRIPLTKGALYTEVPGGTSPGILDGFMTSLLALHDLFVETGDPEVRRLFLEGIAGLKSWLPAWNYRGKWSWYGSREYLCSPAYHCLNRLLLTVLSQITCDSELSRVAENWDPARFGPLDRAEIYLAYNSSQTWSRLKHRTWRLRPSAAARLAKAPQSPYVGNSRLTGLDRGSSA